MQNRGQRQMQIHNSVNHFRSCLLGIAVADALGLPMEGMSAKVVARRYPAPDRFHILGPIGFVSDDTEQSALVAQSIARSQDDLELAAKHFRNAMRGWFLRLPFGIGLGTVRACLRLLVGMKTGVNSAGNGAAMRAAIIGVYFADDKDKRLAWGRQLAKVTHTDERAIQGAQFVAEVAALCLTSTDREQILRQAAEVITEESLQKTFQTAMGLGETTPAEAGHKLGNSGFVVHSLALSAWCFLHHGDRYLDGVHATIAAGGDTDTHAAIVGGWLGTLHGAQSIPAPLIKSLAGGPFGEKHLSVLAQCLGKKQKPKYFFWPIALMRNLFLYPIVLAHGFRRIIPF